MTVVQMIIIIKYPSFHVMEQRIHPTMTVVKIIIIIKYPSSLVMLQRVHPTPAAGGRGGG